MISFTRSEVNLLRLHLFTNMKCSPERNRLINLCEWAIDYLHEAESVPSFMGKDDDCSVEQLKDVI